MLNGGSSGVFASSCGLRTKAQHSKVKKLALTVVTRDAKGKSTTLHVQITKLGLPS